MPVTAITLRVFRTAALHTLGYDPCAGMAWSAPAGPAPMPAEQLAAHWVSTLHNWYAFSPQWRERAGVNFVNVLMFATIPFDEVRCRAWPNGVCSATA